MVTIFSNNSFIKVNPMRTINIGTSFISFQGKLMVELAF